MTGRTIVFHSGGVGDFICTLPALAWLARKTTLEVAGIPERIALAETGGIAAAVHSIDAVDFHTVFSEPSSRLSAFCAPYQRAIVWMADEDGALAAGLRAAGIAEVQCFPGLPPSDWEQPAALWYARCLNVSVALPFVVPFPPTVDTADLVIHPGSGDPKKNWPRAYFDELAARLVSAGYTVAWCLGPAEATTAPPAGTVLPPMRLVQVAGYLSGARLFIGNDSGIGHLAALTGCPTLTIFGPTNPRVWQPTGARSERASKQPWPSVRDVELTAHGCLGA